MASPTPRQLPARAATAGPAPCAARPCPPTRQAPSLNAPPVEPPSPSPTPPPAASVATGRPKPPAASASPPDEAASPGVQPAGLAVPPSCVVTPPRGALSQSPSLSPTKTSQSPSKPSQSPSKPAEAATTAKRKHAELGWDNGEGFAGYMRAKTRKLRAQFGREYGGVRGGALSGVVAWVDGYTTPTRLQLRDVLGRHGGALETYFTDRVTHVVAETLAAATRKRMKGMTKRTFKVVTPAWVVQSVREGRRLDEADFQVKGMGEPGQRSVANMFKMKRKKKS